MPESPDAFATQILVVTVVFRVMPLSKIGGKVVAERSTSCTTSRSRVITLPLVNQLVRLLGESSEPGPFTGDKRPLSEILILPLLLRLDTVVRVFVLNVFVEILAVEDEVVENILFWFAYLAVSLGKRLGI